MSSSTSRYWKRVLRSFIGGRTESSPSISNPNEHILNFGSRVHVTEFLAHLMQPGSEMDQSRFTRHENLREARLATWSRNKIYKNTIREITERAEEERLRHCWLKGATFLLEDRYPPGVRRLSDLDLLIRRENLGRWYALFREMGFDTYRSLEWIEKNDHSSYVSSTFCDRNEPIEVRLDVHWHLVDFPARRAVGDWNWSLESVWSRHEDHKLSAEHRLLYQADHAFSHSFRRWKWAVDLYYLEQENELDYDFLWTVAKQWNIRAIVQMTKSFVDGLLSVEWLQPLEEREEDSMDVDQSEFVRSGLKGTNRKADYLRICASLLDGIMDKLTFWRWILLPPPSALSDLTRQPGYFEWLLIYLERIWDVAKSGIRTYVRSRSV